MRLFSFRIRILMAGIAIAAAACGVAAARRRREFCLREAGYHEQKSAEREATAGEAFGCLSCPDQELATRELDERRARFLRQAAYHRSMAALYRRAADRPWAPTPGETSRRDAYREIAARHAKAEAYASGSVSYMEKSEDRERPEVREYIAFWRVEARYHAPLRRKYEAAAQQPWLPVAPDPPETACHVPVEVTEA